MTENAERASIYLVRHGETLWNLEGRLQGHKDSPLTALGLEQARAAGGILRRELGSAPDLPILSSPLPRAWQTAAIVAETMTRRAADIRLDARLKERAYGVFEGKTGEDLRSELPAEFVRWTSGDWNYQVPGGESMMQLEERVEGWLAAQPPGRPRVVVCHGITSQVLRGLYLGLDRTKWLALPKTQGVVFKLFGGALEELRA